MSIDNYLLNLICKKPCNMTEAEILEHVEELRCAIAGVAKLFKSLLEDAEALADEVRAWRAAADNPSQKNIDFANSERQINEIDKVLQYFDAMKEKP